MQMGQRLPHARLQQRLDPIGKKYQVVNASISGDTTSGGLSRLPQLLNKHQPSMAILELGANDTLRGLSLQQTRNNLEAMIAMCRQTGAKVPLLGMQVPSNYGPRYTADFARIFVDVSQAQKTTLVPFLLKGIADAPDSQRWFLPDRLHPNAPRRRTGFWKTSGHLYGACWTEQIQALTPKHRFRAVETPSMPESA